jgi:hypothetical protein
LPSFAIFPKPNYNHLPKKHNLYTREKIGLNIEKKENFLMDLAAIDMDKDIIVENDAEKSMNNLLRETNNIIDNYYPNKKTQ